MSEVITYTEAQFCKVANISLVTAWRLRNAGKLKYSRVGRKIIYTQEHLKHFLSSIERNKS